MEFVTYKAYLGFDTLFDSNDSNDLLNDMSILFDSFDTGERLSTFEIITEYVNRTPLYYATVNIPKWSETILLIKFGEYEWQLIEESTE